MTTESTNDVAQRFTHRSGTIASLISAIGIVIGTLGPWMTTPAKNWSGLAMFVGVFTLILALISIGFSWRILQRRGRPFGGHRFVTPILATLSTLWALLWVISIDQNGTAMNYGEAVDPGVGWGLWLVLVSSTALLAASLVLVGQSAKAK